MKVNKNSLVCLGCSKYYSEDNLINSVKGFFCEDCYQDHE